MGDRAHSQVWCAWCAGCTVVGVPSMSGPLPTTAASLSSSGFEDGLGRRLLAFDRETGDMLERLIVRAELGAFERVLLERIAAVGALEDERVARPRGIERDDE